LISDCQQQLGRVIRRQNKRLANEKKKSIFGSKKKRKKARQERQKARNDTNSAQTLRAPMKEFSSKVQRLCEQGEVNKDTPLTALSRMWEDFKRTKNMKILNDPLVQTLAKTILKDTADIFSKRCPCAKFITDRSSDNILGLCQQTCSGNQPRPVTPRPQQQATPQPQPQPQTQQPQQTNQQPQQPNRKSGRKNRKNGRPGKFGRRGGKSRKSGKSGRKNRKFGRRGGKSRKSGRKNGRKNRKSGRKNRKNGKKNRKNGISGKSGRKPPVFSFDPKKCSWKTQKRLGNSYSYLTCPK